MAKTNASSATAYCSGAEFLTRYDARTVGDLCGDNGLRVGDNGDDTVNVTTVAADANLAVALKDASGDVEAAALIGGRYTAAELAALTGMAANKLKRIVAGLAMGYLIERRPTVLSEIPASVKQAAEWLESLANGTKIFAVQEAMDAGQLQTEDETVTDVETRRMTTFHLRKLFGRRSDRWTT